MITNAIEAPSRPLPLNSNESLSALLTPRSIALLGASARPGSLGSAMVSMAKAGNYAGEVFPINPQYPEIAGLRAFPDLRQLPTKVDHVVIGVGNDRLEDALTAAAEHGARAATIFASCVSPNAPDLKDRLRSIAERAGMAICGGNCMGFYNNEIGLRVAGFPALQPMPSGKLGLISQSGSVFGALAHNDTRLRFATIISSGAEMVTTTADYLCHMVRNEAIAAVGLFIKSIRDPQTFALALEEAANRNVAVIVLKVGRTAKSAEMALSHTGAIAGTDAVYSGIFRHFGAIQVDDLDELAATMLLFQQPRRASKGGLVAVHDSGGERELVVDLAEKVGLTYASPSPETLNKVGAIISEDLKPANPLDAWGSSANFEATFSDSLSALLEDDDAAAGAIFCNIRDGYYVSEGVSNAAIDAHGRTDKPVAVITNYSLVQHNSLAATLTERGIPVLDGARVGLRALRLFIEWQPKRPAALQRPADLPVLPDVISTISRYRNAALPEAEALALLSRYGISTPVRKAAGNADDIRQLASSLNFPVVLKTATEGILHKSDVGGVVLGIVDPAALEKSYEDMSARLGPLVNIVEMVPKGVELALGAIIEDGWPPIVMIAAGGVLIEYLADVAFDVAPLDRPRARSLLDSLSIKRLLSGHRGASPADQDAVIEAIVRFSWLVSDMAPHLAELDVNPVIAGPAGAMAVDALIVSSHLEDVS